MHSLEASSGMDAVLVLADGKCFFGSGVGKKARVTGEICFNTAITGYQEILTDPSYAGQIITFTYPHIGNTGCNDYDNESSIHGANGLVIRNAITRNSNYRSNTELNVCSTKPLGQRICVVIRFVASARQTVGAANNHRHVLGSQQRSYLCCIVSAIND